MGRKKSATIPMAEFYEDWISTLAAALLPGLRRAMVAAAVEPTSLSVQVEALHEHFNLYYNALDEAAAGDVSQCLFPAWRGPLEKPFLWLGDLHPYLFSNLLRSFLDDQEGEEEEAEERRDLTARVDQIECGLRLMVPALAARAREAQMAAVKRLGAEWGDGLKEKLAAAMEELREVAVDANRLRRSVLDDVLSATTTFQGALFLEALGEFFVGFRQHKFAAAEVQI